MELDELSSEEVRDYYDELVERNSFLSELKGEHEDELREDEDAVEVARKEVNSEIERAKKHDSMLTSTISAFLPGGQIERETGWVFRGAEPLSEYNESNADAIFCNPERNIALIVECKTSVSSPGSALTQIYDAAEAVRQHREELSDHIDMEIDQLETAICVPSYHDEVVARRIEEEEENGDAEERVYLWRLHYLQETERLDLFTSFANRTRSEATHDSELSQVLNSGVEITKQRQVTPSFYPSSHTFQIMEAAFGQILKRRITNDGPLREFSEEELREILTSQRHLPHYSAETVGNRILGGLTDRLMSDNLVTEIDSEDAELTDGSEYYRYRVRGRSIETVLNNLKEKYRQRALDKKLELRAIEAALREFDEQQRSFDEFF
ncbi:hypothetical protein C453_01465 [Haloferax elongans ATCC BAA-1513]|uniref:Uncharacterized protein n=1 Tax=Haloferax elongans ATCC BAA-1513 TaxID=1230453 RepID=M0HVJ6_HALEO|nr:hypothetical protein [Haloferax elongans]ELZ88491.1 hypothetical protein C453_01465 [Haloferax elongans ATCC BAA-1513]